MFPYRQFSVRSIILLMTAFAAAGAIFLVIVGPSEFSKFEQVAVMVGLAILIFFPCDALLEWYLNQDYDPGATDVRDIVFVWILTFIAIFFWAVFRFSTRWFSG